MTRRALLASGIALGSGLALAAEPPRDVAAEQDFDELWRTLAERYCYFQEKTTNWQRVRSLYRPMALAAQTDAEFIEVVRLVLAELYDPHTHLADPPKGSPRWPPYDIVVERDGAAARVLAVEDGSAAALAGLRPGDMIVAVDDVALPRLAASLMPRCLRRPDPAAERYAWSVAVAGRKGNSRRFMVKSGQGVPRPVALPLSGGASQTDLSWRRRDGGLGYIRIANFGDRATVARFDGALHALRDARGLLIDVRSNGGGDTAVARPIMGRFIGERRPYAQMRRRRGDGLSEAWIEHVEPRGPFTYTRPVVVLVDHWSASMAEGFPMGMRAVAHARIVGTRMAGLGAAVFALHLDRTGVQAQYSAEPVYDVAGAPRAQLRPDVEVPAGGNIVDAGFAELRRLIGS